MMYFKMLHLHLQFFKFVFCLIFFSLCFPCYADNLTLKQALDISLENNHHIKSATATLPIARAKLIIAKYRPNPNLGSNAEIVKGGSLHPIQLGAEIELGRKRHWRIELAKEEISKTELEIRKVIWEIHTQVHAAYGRLAVLEGLYKLAKERAGFYKSLVEIAEKRYAAGDISRLELIRAETELLAAENKLSEVDGEVRNAKIEFNHLLGDNPNLNISLTNPEDLKPKIELHKHPKMKEIIENALENRIEIAILEKEFGITRAKLRKAIWERLPNLKIEGGPTKPSLGNNIWGPYVGGGFELPVFNRKQGEIKDAKAELDFLKKEEDRIKHDIKIEVATAFQYVEVREEQINRFKEKLIAEAEDILDMIRTGFQKGKLNLTDVLIAEQQNREVREKYLESIMDYQISLANLEYAVGVPLFEFGEEL